jgi:hypothetical protein
MATTATVSLTLPNEVLAQARAMASSDDLPLDELVAIAIGRYAQSRQAFEAMLREGQQYGRQIGITSEEDVERIANGELTLEGLRRTA